MNKCINNLILFLSIFQIGEVIFNKGRVMNAGFLEAMKMFSFDCAIFHDVDLIPEHDGNLYDCGDQPRHLSVAIDKMNYKYVICYYLLRLLSLLMNKKKKKKRTYHAQYCRNSEVTSLCWPFFVVVTTVWYCFRPTMTNFPT